MREGPAPAHEAESVTVVLCSRNGHSRGFLSQAIASVLAQTRPAAEILLIDDASSDGTAAAVRSAHPTVTVLANSGRGLAAARNTGVRAARGNWIAFLDDDDVWHPDKLAQQLVQAGACGNPGNAILSARAAYIDAHGAPAAMFLQQQLASWPACLLDSPLKPSAVLMSRALLERVGMFDDTIAEGAAYDCWIRCLAAGATIHYSDAILLHYRRHAGQMTRHARKIEHLFPIDALVMRHVGPLAPALAARVGSARRLANLRTTLVHCGPGAAAHYWRTTPLPWDPGWRVLAYSVLNPLVSRAPLRSRAWLQRTVLRLLLGQAA